MKLKYGLNDKPSVVPLLLYGIQWFIITIPIILILSAIVARYQFNNASDQLLYTQKMFALMGIGLIVQVLWGHRLPLVIGPASVLLIGVMSAGGANLETVSCAMMLGGALLLLLALTGWLERIVSIFTPRIVMVILSLIAFTLSPVILDLVFSVPNAPLFSLFLVIVLALGMLLLNQLLRGVWKSLTVVIGLGVGSAIYGGYLGFADLSVENEVEQQLLWISSLSFDPATVLAFLFCYIALFINELGSIQSVGKLIDVDRLDIRTKRGVGVIGMMNILSGGMGVIGPVDFSLSPGIISATGCASRYTLLPAGVGLILFAFFPDFIRLLSQIPLVVMGAIMLYLMSTQLAAALQIGGKSALVSDFSSGITVGMPLMIALLLAFAPQSALDAIPLMIRPIVGNGFVMGVITVLLLEHLLFRRNASSR